MLTFAIPKGRIYKELQPMLEAASITPEDDFFNPDCRRLMFYTACRTMRIIRVRSFDVATFVAFGGADFGVCGSDVLMEFDYPDLYAPVDLNIGHCRLSVAAPINTTTTIHTTTIGTTTINTANFSQHSHLRVATKYPRLTSAFFARHGVQAECIKLNGAMEIAPALGLANHIVDLVSSGATLEANGLQELEVIMPVTSRLVVNRPALKTSQPVLMPYINAMREAAERR